MLVNSLDQAENAFHLCWLRYRRLLEELEDNQKALTGLRSQMEQAHRQLRGMKEDGVVPLKEYKKLQDRIEKSTNDIAVVDATVESLDREVSMSKKRMEEAEDMVRIARKRIEERGRLYEFKTNQD